MSELDHQHAITDAAIGIAIYGKARPRLGVALMRLMDFHVERLLEARAAQQGLTVDEFCNRAIVALNKAEAFQKL